MSHENTGPVPLPLFRALASRRYRIDLAIDIAHDKRIIQAIPPARSHGARADTLLPATCYCTFLVWRSSHVLARSMVGCQRNLQLSDFRIETWRRGGRGISPGNSARWTLY